MRKPGGQRPTRRIGDRKPRRIIRVHLEGAVTEKGYLKRLVRRNRDVQIDFGSTGCAPLTLVENALADMRERARRNSTIDFDEIWCVFDVDQHPNLSQARDEARQGNIATAVSNPCFELWLVLHAESQTGNIKCRAVQRRAAGLGLIKDKAIPNTAWIVLDANYDVAKRRATNLDQMHTGNGSPAGHNPSSDMWQLVDRVLRDNPDAGRISAG